MYILSLKPQFLSQRDPKRIIQEVHKGPYDNTPRSLSLSLSTTGILWLSVLSSQLNE